MNYAKKIILVEDNIADVELTKLSFANLKQQVDILHFFNGQELIDFLNGNTEIYSEVSFILLDLNMPKLGGIDVLRLLGKRPTLKKIPVIVFTSSVHQVDVQTCYELGANAYITKPIDIMEFERAISAIAQFWCGLNILAQPNQSLMYHTSH